MFIGGQWIDKLNNDSYYIVNHEEHTDDLKGRYKRNTNSKYLPSGRVDLSPNYIQWQGKSVMSRESPSTRDTHRGEWRGQSQHRNSRLWQLHNRTERLGHWRKQSMETTRRRLGTDWRPVGRGSRQRYLSATCPLLPLLALSPPPHPLLKSDKESARTSIVLPPSLCTYSLSELLWLLFFKFILWTFLHLRTNWNAYLFQRGFWRALQDKVELRIMRVWTSADKTN